ncbi:MAG: hypothetical protein V1743_04230 [Nanoarchaeota archaeon]
MMYTLERQVTTLGKGITMRHDASSYEQIACQDGFTARIFRNNADEPYTGILYHKIFSSDSERDRRLYISVASRLEQVSGTKIQGMLNEYGNFNHWNPLKQKLKTGITVRMNPQNGMLPDGMKSYENNRTFISGFISASVAYGSVITAVYVFTDTNLQGLQKQSLLSIGAFVMGVVDLCFVASHHCGILSAPAYLTAKHFAGKKLRNPTAFLDDFARTSDRREQMGKTPKDPKKSEKLSRKLDALYAILQEQFPYTTRQKGFSIHSQSLDREKILALFTYVLQDGTVPQLAGKGKAEGKPAPPPIQAGFIDPWKIEEPRMGEREADHD